MKPHHFTIILYAITIALIFVLSLTYEINVYSPLVGSCDSAMQLGGDFWACIRLQDLPRP